MNEVVLGFQLRVRRADLEPWSSARRRDYLLHEDVELPLSVDIVVWPNSHSAKLLSSLFSDYSPGANAAPNGLDVYRIGDPSVLKRLYVPEEPILIGITVASPDPTVARELKSRHSIMDIPAPVEQLYETGLRCLGYDVADHWLTSGLMNCGYVPDRKIVLAERFPRSDLNDLGLFVSPDIANDYRIDCDIRVREHSPFVVYGIWCNTDTRL